MSSASRLEVGAGWEEESAAGVAMLEAGGIRPDRACRSASGGNRDRWQSWDERESRWGRDRLSSRACVGRVPLTSPVAVVDGVFTRRKAGVYPS